MSENCEKMSINISPTVQNPKIKQQILHKKRVPVFGNTFVCFTAAEIYKLTNNINTSRLDARAHALAFWASRRDVLRAR